MTFGQLRKSKLSGTMIIITLFALVMFTKPISADANNFDQKLKESFLKVEEYTQKASTYSKEKKLRIILDVTGGVRKLLQEVYELSGSENDFQQAYSIALTQLSTLAESMGFHKAASCHYKESLFMQKSSRSSPDDMTGAPKCRLSMYEPGARADAIAMIAKEGRNHPLNILAGSLIKEITSVAFYTTVMSGSAEN